ncbi:MAG: hypothetical protein ACLFUZ_02565 [Candidatus Micrarchaeia archaeon]
MAVKCAAQKLTYNSLKRRRGVLQAPSPNLSSQKQHFVHNRAFLGSSCWKRHKAETEKKNGERREEFLRREKKRAEDSLLEWKVQAAVYIEHIKNPLRDEIPRIHPEEDLFREIEFGHLIT